LKYQSAVAVATLSNYLLRQELMNYGKPSSAFSIARFILLSFSGAA
jgi:hypothetical protein